LSTEEDDLAIEETADIHAPWVEPAIDEESPLQEGAHHPPSPPRVRSASQSPARRPRRGSLLKHDITNEILEERGRERLRNAGVENLPTSVDKGKGKQVAVEDSEEE
jgi:hypothetical protein